MQFTKKTSSRTTILSVIIKLSLASLAILLIVFLLNKIEFPAPKKEIDRIIPNENFKVIK